MHYTRGIGKFYNSVRPGAQHSRTAKLNKLTGGTILLPKVICTPKASDFRGA